MQILKTKTTIIVIICGLLTSAALFSRETDADKLLSWPDCVSLASNNNPDIMSAMNSLKASRSSYYGSYNGFFPQIDLSHSYSDSDRAITAGTADNVSWQTRGSVSLNILNMQQIAGFRASQASLTQAEAALRQNSSLVRYNLRKAFNQLLFVQKNIEVSKSIVKMRQDESQLVSLRYESGKESKGNMLRAKAQLLQAQADLSQSIRDLRTAQRVLGQQLGLESFSAITLVSDMKTQEPPDFPKEEGQLLRQRPDVALQEAAVKSAEAALKQSKSSRWPSLTANYSKSSSGATEFSDFQSNWGLVLNYPLFGSGPTAAYYAVSASKSNLEKTIQDLRSVQQQALVDIESAWSSFVGALEQSKVQSALLESSRQRYEEANIRYDSGLMTYDSWEIIASDRVNQERQATQAQLAALNAESAWQRSLGKQLEE